MFDPLFEGAAWLIATFYAWTHNYAIAVGLVAVAVMLLITPLTLKSTKGMLEMQRLQPEMRRLQAEYRGDRQRLNEEMMKLYQEHKVNPLASCLPLLAQMPVFIIMFQVLSGISRLGDGGTFQPDHIKESSELYQSLAGKSEMVSFGLDLAVTPLKAMQDNFGRGLWYALLIVALGGLFFIQQRMIASRTSSPTMSPTQAKIMQYLPVAFAGFQIFLPTSLVFYYMVQAIIRIGQQWYITRRFYGDEQAIGRQAQAASARAREMNLDDKGSKKKAEAEKPRTPVVSRRVTPPKNRPTPSGRTSRPLPPSRRGGSSERE